MRGKGWVHQQNNVIDSTDAQAGLSLAAVSGGLSEVLHHTKNEIGEAYERDGTGWTQGKLLIFKVIPATMLASVAWKYATPFFQIRVFVTGGQEEVQEYTFSRELGGWKEVAQQLSSPEADDLSAMLYPVSAIAAAMVGDGCSYKVYFHPRRFIAE
ncbi:hypothetical protein F5Y19DRAFT_427560 [Xylariaceae sp. FL1651]|nr:hypothetical protein F5Y19DRAFT_427560 [Xylariaceae sp. FL1651]